MILDTTVTPKPLTGSAGQDLEGWFEYFEQYCDFRQLAVTDKRKQFGTLLQKGAGDWLSTLRDVERMSYADLTKAVKISYYKSPELK